ncbi:hypothetical protein D9M72_532270 [compost metagenome]
MRLGLVGNIERYGQKVGLFAETLGDRLRIARRRDDLIALGECLFHNEGAKSTGCPGNEPCMHVNLLFVSPLHRRRLRRFYRAPSAEIIDWILLELMSKIHQ